MAVKWRYSIFISRNVARPIGKEEQNKNRLGERLRETGTKQKSRRRREQKEERARKK
jgi:hypothetical protein